MQSQRLGQGLRDFSQVAAHGDEGSLARLPLARRPFRGVGVGAGPQKFERVHALPPRRARWVQAELQTAAGDAPLVAHFCGNEPATLLAAAQLAQPHCVAVDLNLGCPQRIAHSGHFGSYLLDEEDRPLVLRIVRTLASTLQARPRARDLVMIAQ